MKVVILAAGQGSRFGGRDVPKALTELANGQSILQFQLDQIAQVIPLSCVSIVVGYHQEMIRKAFPSLSYVENLLYFQQNTSKSLLRALEEIDDDCLWLNGDVVFNSKVIPLLLLNGKTAMVVNRTAVGEEEVKYRTDEKGMVLEVSKHVKNPQGEAVGINLIRKKDLSPLRRELDKCLDTDYFEKGIEGCIKGGVEVGTVLVDPTDCIEVDFPEDLDKANIMLAKWLTYP